MELGGKPVPKLLEPYLIRLRDRVRELKERYGSLARWGRPIFESIDEVAVLFWLNEKMGISLDRIASFIGIDKTTLYKVYKKVHQGVVAIYDREENRVKQVQVNVNDLINMVEEILQPSAKQKIKDVFQSDIIKRFWEQKIPKRAKIAGKPSYLSDKEKLKVIRIVERIMQWLKENKPDYPTNPDFWEESVVEEALWAIYKGDYRRVANAMILIRRVPEWSGWFKGKIGAVTKRVNPSMKVIYYEDYLRLKHAWRSGKLSDAEFLVLWLHITTGAREGYTLYTDSTPLENPEVKSSLVGLRWENLSKVGDTWILKIYESKTEKWWTCDLSWLDEEPLTSFLRYAKDRGNIIATITSLKTVGEFKKWYRRTLKKVSEILKLPFVLNPHAMRRSHISILAELGVPMEFAISGHMDFGVGWEDAKTALIFYLRFSKYTKKLIREKMDALKREIAKDLQL